jgi:glycosyltransferase involved in cell wall biosynthesis
MDETPQSIGSSQVRRALFIATVHTTLEAFLIPFATRLRQRGWVVDAMAGGIASSTACTRAFDKTFEVAWSRNPVDPRNLLRPYGLLRTAVRERHYGVVHVHTPVAALVGRLALRDLRSRFGFSVVYTAHGFHFHPDGSPITNSVFLGLERLAGRWTDHLVVLNDEDEIAARRFGIVPPGRLHRMPSAVGIDTAESERDLSGDVERARQMLGLGPTDKVFVMVAEFIPRKRHRDALEAFARLSRRDTHLALAGDGPLRDSMERLATRLGIQDRVHFLGFRSDVAVLMRASVATLLPSAREGLPQSMLESLNLGTPAIGTAIRGTRELLQDGAGILIDVGDIEGLTSAMSRILDDPAYAAHLSVCGRRRAARYDARRVMLLHEHLYEALVSEGGTPQQPRQVGRGPG